MKLMKMKRSVDEEIGDAIELFESAHYVVPSHDSETGNTSYNAMDAPAFRSVRRLKQKRSDYKPGKVKVYTQQEIEEYERAKASRL